MVITMAKLRMAHASTHGARKPPGPKKERLNDGNNNGTHGARKPPGPKHIKSECSITYEQKGFLL